MKIKTTLRNVFQTGGGGTSIANVMRKIGDWSSNSFPPSTASSMNFYVTSTFVTIDGVPLPEGTIILSMQDTPTSDWSITGWKYF